MLAQVHTGYYMEGRCTICTGTSALNILSAFSCSSYVGKQGGRQTISLRESRCFVMGTIIHEVLHALGMTHEDQRPDRNCYVSVNEAMTNLTDEKCNAECMETNFDIWEDTDISLPYDIQSIMHYGAFGKHIQVKDKRYFVLSPLISLGCYLSPVPTAR